MSYTDLYRLGRTKFSYKTRVVYLARPSEHLFGLEEIFAFDSHVY